VYAGDNEHFSEINIVTDFDVRTFITLVRSVYTILVENPARQEIS
jgi:hypothetical protein